MQAEVFCAQRCAVSGVTAVTAQTARAFARHSHDQFGIGLIDAGAQTSHSGRGQVQAERGDLITVNPGEVHDGLPIAAASRRWRMLYFDPAVIHSLVPDQAEFHRPLLRAVASRQVFRRLFATLNAPTPVAPLSVQSDLRMLIAALQEQPRRDPPPVATLTAALQRLQDDPATPVSLAELAALSGTSRFHFLRSFAARTGLPPHAFQMQQRLHLARRLIAARTPLAETAAAAGFADQSHLSRLFRRCYGLTPGAYARAFA